MVTDPDESLIKKARQGDRQAFGKLVDKYYEMVFSLAIGVLREREAARDVTQDVFLKVYRDLSKFSGKSKFKTWLYRVAVNQAIDSSRKRRPQESIDTTDASDDQDQPPRWVVDKDPSPRAKARQSELHALLEKAMQELSEEHRAVMVLREFQGLSYEEIAETLEIELGTVMSRLHYGRKKLAEILKPLSKELKQ